MSIEIAPNEAALPKNKTPVPEQYSEEATRIRRIFMSKNLRLRVELLSSDAAIQPPAYFLSVSRGAYLFSFSGEVAKVFRPAYGFPNDVPNPSFTLNNQRLPFDLPFAILADLFGFEANLKEEFITFTFRFRSPKEPMQRLEEALNEPFSHFIQNLKEATFIRTQSGDVFKKFASQQVLTSMRHALESQSYSEFEEATRELTKKFENQFIPVRVLLRGNDLMVSRSVPKNETVGEFLNDIFGSQWNPQAKVVSGGIVIDLSATLECLNAAMMFPDCWIYLTIIFPQSAATDSKSE